MQLLTVILVLGLSLSVCAENVQVFKADIETLNGDLPQLNGFLRRKCIASPITEPWRYYWVHPDGTRSTGQYLSVDRLKSSQIGNYRCIAEAPLHTLIANTFVDFRGSGEQGTNSNSDGQDENSNSGGTDTQPDEANVEIQGIAGEQLHLGGSIRRRCLVDMAGWQVHWLRPDGTRINGQYLIVNDLKVTDVGQYTCVAIQLSSGIIKYRFLFLQFPETTDSLNIIPLSGENLVAGGSLLRQCVPTSRNYDVYWVLPDGRRVDGMYLTVYNLRRSDAGKYVCHAVNSRSGGTMMAWFSFTLAEAAVYTNVQIRREPDNDLRYGGTLSLRCTADQSGWDISWTYPNGRVVRSQYLRITNLATRDFGKYWCIARNRRTQQKIEAWYKLG